MSGKARGVLGERRTDHHAALALKIGGLEVKLIECSYVALLQAITSLSKPLHSLPSSSTDSTLSGRSHTHDAIS